MYFDVNGLYSKAQTYKLPVGDFKMLTRQELDEMQKDHSKIKSCILEVDLIVPDDKKFHDYTKDFPLAPETKVVLGSPKLVPNLLNVIHYVELKCYLRYGLVLEKIHNGFSFREEHVVRDCIEFNNDLRTKATTKFGKDFFKLQNNACFGKFLENLRKRCDVKLVDEASEKGRKRLTKLIADPTYVGVKRFENSSLLSVSKHKGKITLDKPIAMGVAILGISKAIVFYFHYGYAKKKWRIM